MKQTRSSKWSKSTNSFLTFHCERFRKQIHSQNDMHAPTQQCDSVDGHKHECAKFMFETQFVLYI